MTDYLNQSTVTASSSQFEANVVNNTADVQIVPNAEIVIVKHVVNDDGGEGVLSDFIVASSAGVLTFDGGSVSGDTTSYTSDTLFVPPGTYSLEENDVIGYDEGTWSCTVGTMGSTDHDSGSVTLDFGQQTICFITNDDVAPTLTLVKNVINDDNGSLTDADFSLAIDGTGVFSGTPTTVTANAPLTISEADVAGYAEGTWSCLDNNGQTTTLPSAGIATGTSFEIELASDVVCSISNDDIAPTLTLAKTVVNDNGGNLSSTDFDLTIAQDGTSTVVLDGVAENILANTDVEISELDLPGYTEGTWSCVDAQGLTSGLPAAGSAVGETFQLKEGSEVTCAISNDDIAPVLTLAKTVVNDNGGNLAIEDFDISIDGVEVTDSVAYPVDANTIITISELDLVPYAEGVWECTDAASLTTGLPTTGVATGTDLTLLPGSVVTCAITNNDLGIDLQIAKSVDDATPNIGQTITFTLDVNNAGPDIATDVTVVDPIPAGFTYVASSIAGGDLSDDSDPVGGGLSWTIDAVPVGTTVSLTFDVVVNAP